MQGITGRRRSPRRGSGRRRARLAAGLAGLVALGAGSGPLAACGAGAEPASTTVAFLAVGDQGTGGAAQRRVAAAMDAVAGRDRVDFVILLGDNFYPDGVDSPDDPQWREKFERVYSLPCLERLPFYAVLGNHDHRGDPRAQIAYARRGGGSGRWRMPARFYSRDFGRAPGDAPLVRIAFLDTGPGSGEGNPIADVQSAAIARAFARRPSPRWRIAAGHHPIRSVGRHGDTPALSRWLLPALRATGVDLYLAGHDHDLEVLSTPGEPLQVVAGGGGASPYRLRRGRPGPTRVEFARAAHGFARIVVRPEGIVVEILDERARPIFRRPVTHPSASRRAGAGE